MWPGKPPLCDLRISRFLAHHQPARRLIGAHRSDTRYFSTRPILVLAPGHVVYWGFGIDAAPCGAPARLPGLTPFVRT
jgi:hypothetical protein